MRFFYILFFTSFLFCLPRFSIETGTSCLNCHINPTGGGMRNDYGTNIFALDELTLKRLIKNADDMWDGYISENLQIGGDFRIQLFDDGNDSKIFPMQADFYVNLRISNDTDMYFKVDTSPYRNDEFFILFKNIIDKIWIKLGKTLPNYGLKIDDHTSFIRGGNRTSLTGDSVDEGLFFDPVETGNPILLETGIKLSQNLNLNFSIANGFIVSNQNEMLNTAVTLNYFKNFDNFSIMTGTSYMSEKEITSKGVFGGLSVKNMTISFEVDQVENWIDLNNSNAIYTQFVYKPIQGLHLIAKYDYFDRHTDYLSGTISRYSTGFEIYPLNILEIKFQLRKNKIDNYDNDQMKLHTEYLIQVHTWF